MRARAGNAKCCARNSAHHDELVEAPVATSQVSIVPDEESNHPPAGWYRDPGGHFEFRFWDGVRWRDDVTSNGRRLIAPLAWPAPPLPERQAPTQQPRSLPDPLEEASPFPASSGVTSHGAAMTGVGNARLEHEAAMSLFRQTMVVGAISLVAGGAMMVGANWSPVLTVLIFLALTVFGLWLVISGLIYWLQSRDPRPPQVPKLRTARRPRIPREPKKQVAQLSSRCVICGRPLTNAQSMRARVGSTCIKTYGPRYAWVANPQHIAWQRLLTAAEKNRETEQMRLNIAHAAAMLEYPRLLSAWEVERQSPSGQVRAVRRTVAARRLLLGGVVAPIAMFVGLAAVLPYP